MAPQLTRRHRQWDDPACQFRTPGILDAREGGCGLFGRLRVHEWLWLDLAARKGQVFLLTYTVDRQWCYSKTSLGNAKTLRCFYSFWGVFSGEMPTKEGSFKDFSGVFQGSFYLTSMTVHSILTLSLVQKKWGSFLLYLYVSLFLLKTLQFSVSWILIEELKKFVILLLRLKWSIT